MDIRKYRQYKTSEDEDGYKAHFVDVDLSNGHRVHFTAWVWETYEAKIGKKKAVVFKKPNTEKWVAFIVIPENPPGDRTIEYKTFDIQEQAFGFAAVKLFE